MDLVTLYQQNFQSNCAQAAIVAVVAYEYAITLQNEVNLIWGGKTTSSTIFRLNRLIMIGLVVAYVLDMFTWTTNMSCRVVSVLYVVLELLTYLEWAVVSALRVYVMYSQFWLPATATLMFALVPVAFNIFTCSQTTYLAIEIMPGMTVCDSMPRYSGIIGRRAVIISRTFAITSDLVVVSVTLWRTLDHACGLVRSRERKTLPDVLLRDGTIYFIVLLCLNCLQVIVDNVAAVDICAIFI
ncbi:hypothetical protein FOMPIDRAFT_1156976, partial [Fomitopsis schrenkii]